MKKIYLVIIVIGAIVSCTNANSKESNNQQSSLEANECIKTVVITPVMKEDFEKVKRAFSAQVSNLKIKKIDGKIVLPFDGKDMIFKDSTSDPESSNYTKFEYIGFYEKINSYVLKAIYYEDSEFIVINKKTRQKESIWSKPVISPSGKLISSYKEYGLEGHAVGVQIFSYRDNDVVSSFNLIYEVNQRGWNPKEIVWESDSSLLIKASEIPSQENGFKNSDSFCYLRLKLS